MKTHLNHSYRTTTKVAGKLPEAWQQKGTTMAHKVTYLVKAYNIPTYLEVNTY
jgi:hypothetical protein